MAKKNKHAASTKTPAADSPSSATPAADAVTKAFDAALAGGNYAGIRQLVKAHPDHPQAKRALSLVTLDSTSLLIGTVTLFIVCFVIFMTLR